MLIGSLRANEPKSKDVTSDQVPMWVKRAEAQGVLKSILAFVQEDKDKEFEIIKCAKTINGSLSRSQTQGLKNQGICKYCGTVHDMRRFPAFQRSCPVCRQQKHFESICRNQVEECHMRNPKSYSAGPQNTVGQWQLRQKIWCHKDPSFQFSQH